MFGQSVVHDRAWYHVHDNLTHAAFANLGDNCVLSNRDVVSNCGAHLRILPASKTTLITPSARFANKLNAS